MLARRGSTERDAFGRKGCRARGTLKNHRPFRAGAENVKRNARNFGLHLTLDGYLCDARRIGDLETVTRALADLPGRMGMKRLIPPYVVEAAANRKRDPGGYSGFVMIQESHISVHTFPRRRFVSIDLYSCRNFRTAPAIAFFKRAFDIKKTEVNVIVRGKEYPAANIA